MAPRPFLQPDALSWFATPPGPENAQKNTLYSWMGENGGAIELPRASVNWVGNASTQQPCTQLIADTIQFVGTSGLSVSCFGYGTKPIALASALQE